MRTRMPQHGRARKRNMARPCAGACANRREGGRHAKRNVRGSRSAMRFELFRYVGYAALVFTGAAAFGCGSTYEPVQSHTASYVKSSSATTAKKPDVSP